MGLAECKACNWKGWNKEAEKVSEFKLPVSEQASTTAVSNVDLDMVGDMKKKIKEI